MAATLPDCVAQRPTSEERVDSANFDALEREAQARMPAPSWAFRATEAHPVDALPDLMI
jgi:hypothetical protein